MIARAAAPTPDRIERIDLGGTVLQVHLASGRVIAGQDLEGATLALKLPGSSDPQRVLIEQVVKDPNDASGDLLLYRMSVLNVATGGRDQVCDADAQGEQWVFPVQGQWDSQGKRLSQAGFTLTCSSGAQGKCVRFGYKPWRTTPEGVRLDDFHQACVRMVTAAYCDGRGTTRDGMTIDFYDSLGIQQPENGITAKPLLFEAAWDANGALCVAHTRVPANISLQQLGASCPSLRGRLGEAECTEAAARSGRLGRALLFNRSF
jgi:hypothetical protein